MDSLSKLWLGLSGWNFVDEKDGFIVVERGSLLQMRSGLSSVYTTFNRARLFTHSYWDYLSASAAFRKGARVLMIGLGGGTVAIQMDRWSRPRTLDVVEVNKGVADLAKRHFLGSVSCNIVVGDGATFIKGRKSAYDLIVLDAFVGLLVPKVFLGKPFVDDAFEALGDSGLLVINIISKAQLNECVSALRGRFEVYAITPLALGNTILVCTKNLSKSEVVERIEGRLSDEKEAAFLVNAYANMRPL